MNRDELNRIKDRVLITVAEQMGLDPFELRESDRKRCDLTIDAVLPLIEADVRSRIVTEIGNTMFNVFDVSGPYYDGIQKAQSIARGTDR